MTSRNDHAQVGSTPKMHLFALFKHSFLRNCKCKNLKKLQVIENIVDSKFSAKNVVQIFDVCFPLRIAIAAIAFRMGIDCPEIHRIIDWDPPSDIE